MNRIDLNFRYEYLGIKTEIYKINKHDYQIYCENYKNYFENFEQLMNAFNKIRWITVPVKLIKNRPEKYLKLIENISEQDIPKNFEGIYLNKADFDNFIYSKFPDVKFGSFTEQFENEPSIIIKVFDSTSAKKIEEIKTFIMNMKLPLKILVKKTKVTNEYIPEVDNISLVSVTNKEFSFSKRDSSLWFENVDKIFKGEFHKKDIDFYEEDKMSCYMDFSVFDNINIRNNLLLYDVVYSSLPLKERTNDFFNKQKIRKKDHFLDLIEMGKVKILLPNDERRYDINLLNEIKEVNENSILTRRGIATILMVEFVDISNNYILNDQRIIEELPLLYEIISNYKEVDEDKVFDFLTWPLRVKKEAFDVLNNNSPLRLGNFGVNNIISNYFGEHKKSEALEFELMANSSAIHIAHALESTYFPFKTDGKYTDSPYANMMGELLNLYKHSTNKGIQELKDFNDPVDEIKECIHGFEVNKYMDINEFSKYTLKINSPKKVKSLIKSLNGLNDKEKVNKIKYYNDMVDQKIKSKNNFFIDLGLFGGGFLPQIGVFISILSGLKDLLPKISINSKRHRQLIDIINEKFYEEDKRNIHFLSKINRIARYK